MGCGCSCGCGDKDVAGKEVEQEKKVVNEKGEELEELKEETIEAVEASTIENE